MKIILSLLLVVFTFLGILDSSYITYEKMSGQVPQCNKYFKCGVVLNSQWASVGPIPLALFGTFFYTFFFCMSVMFFLEKKELHLLGRIIPTKKVLAMLGIFGGMFSLYLIFIMGVILHAWCLYCLLSASICLILSLVSSSLYFLTSKE